MTVINVYVMVGLQGSGKSTYVENQIKASGGIRLNADTLREQNPDDSNEAIFVQLYKDFDKIIQQMIQEKIPERDIYLDNTNFTIKSRRGVFEELRKMQKRYPELYFNITAVILSTPFEICVERNAQRAKPVPVDVIYRYRRSFNIPFYAEGFTNIKIIDGVTLKEINSVTWNKDKYGEYMIKMLNFDQKNPHHIYTLGAHMWATYLLALFAGKFHNEKCAYTAALIHDWGKYFTRSFNDKGYGIYYNHGEIGTYELLSHLDLIPQQDFTKNEILRVLAYVNYHMRPFDWNTEKAKNKAKATFGTALYEDLCAFNKVDKLACGTEELDD